MTNEAQSNLLENFHLCVAVSQVLPVDQTCEYGELFYLCCCCPPELVSPVTPDSDEKPVDRLVHSRSVAIFPMYLL